jgi:hypothetical protein
MSIVDVKDKAEEIVKALELNESVTVLYQGEIKGVITPVKNKKILMVKEHPFFGSAEESSETVLEALQILRKPRYDL